MITAQIARYLWDAKTAIDDILQFTTGENLDDYPANRQLQAAVEREFQIIGEAFVGVRRLDPTVATGIPDLPRIIAFRNVVVHAYSAIDDGLVWQIIEMKLPDLRAHVERLLGTAPPP
jgi:uncharacterized protein with HEPN domain